MNHQQKLVELSSDWLYRIKTAQPQERALTAIQQLSLEDCLQLSTDGSRKAFWINIYNAWFQHLKALKTDRADIFVNKPLFFTDFKLTLDEMEHGILRKLKPHPSSTEGYSFYKNTVVKLALQKEDYRIHFALNCGAKSCPPIKFYTLAAIESELQHATESYLQQECSVDENKKGYANELFKWYLSDFGDLPGLKKILSDFFKKPVNSITFTTYNNSASANDFY